jgi:hypothetical protein
MTIWRGSKGRKKKRNSNSKDEKSQAEDRSPEKRRNATAVSIRQAGRLQKKFPSVKVWRTLSFYAILLTGDPLPCHALKKTSLLAASRSTIHLRITHTYNKHICFVIEKNMKDFSNHKPNPFVSIKPPLAIQFCKQLSVRFTITQLSFVHASSTHKSHSYMRPTHTRVILTCFKHTSVFSSSNPNAIVNTANAKATSVKCDMTAACLTVALLRGRSGSKASKAASLLALLRVRCGRSQTDAPATPRKTRQNENDGADRHTNSNGNR